MPPTSITAAETANAPEASGLDHDANDAGATLGESGTRRSGSRGSFGRLRGRLGDWVESKPVQNVVIGVIVVNAITLGLHTSDAVMRVAGPLITTLDTIFLAIFVVELACKIFARGWRFFTDGWNIFDFLVVGVALVPASGPLAVLRALRVLRVLRLVSVVPQLRFIVSTLLAAIPGIASIGALLGIIFYVAAVMSTELFGGAFPEYFGSIGASLFSLFQIMTLDSWAALVRPVMEEFPAAWLFFVPFIVVSALTMLNLFVAVIVDTMQNVGNARVARQAKKRAEAAKRAQPATSAHPETVESRAAEAGEVVGSAVSADTTEVATPDAPAPSQLTDDELADELARIRGQLDALTTALQRRRAPH